MGGIQNASAVSSWSDDTGQSLGHVSWISRARRLRSSTAPKTSALGEQSRPLDGDAEQVADGIEQPQVVRGELAPVGAGDIHHPQPLVLSVERDAGVVTQAARCRSPGSSAGYR